MNQVCCHRPPPHTHPPSIPPSLKIKSGMSPAHTGAKLQLPQWSVYRPARPAASAADKLLMKLKHAGLHLPLFDDAVRVKNIELVAKWRPASQTKMLQFFTWFKTETLLLTTTHKEKKWNKKKRGSCSTHTPRASGQARARAPPDVHVVLGK